MAQISELTEKVHLDGSEQIPIWNSEPSPSYPDDNYRISLAKIVAMAGSSIHTFAAVVDELSTDVIEGSSSSPGDVVFLKNAKVFAKRVTLTSGSTTSIKYYTSFTDSYCSEGEPLQRRLYGIISEGKYFFWDGEDMVDMFVDLRPEVMTEAAFEELGDIDDDKVRYIVEEEDE